MSENQLAVAPQSALSISQLLNQRQLIQEAMKVAMVEGVHYGKIPGCGEKPTLFQSGAQLLCHLFRLRPEYDIDQTDLSDGHVRFRIKCRLYLMGSEPPMIVSEGIGEGSTMESKHRFRGGSRKCPDCGAAAIIKGKREYGGGYICFAKKGGCGHKWPDGAPEIESQSEIKTENESIADTHNAVLKVTKKRAFVDATITATASNDFFTQDLEDIRQNIDAVTLRKEEPENPPPARQTSRGGHPERTAHPSNGDDDPLPMGQPEVVTGDNWKEVICHFGKPGGPVLGKAVGTFNEHTLAWFVEKVVPRFESANALSDDDRRLMAAIKFALAAQKPPDKAGPAKKREAVKPEASADKSEAAKAEAAGERKSLELLAGNLDFAEVSNETFIAVVRDMKLTPASEFADITETEAAEMLKQIEIIIGRCKKEMSRTEGAE